MKEGPILFSGPMVRAILAGRKTQTRRVLKHPEYFGCLTGDCPHETQWECNQAIAGYAEKECPYGIPGDRLWVKETFQYTDESLNIQPGYVYRATDPDWETMEGWKWKPSIFMPRAASRITLEITGVRVERLQDISEGDAKAEGCSIWDAAEEVGKDCFISIKRSYFELWESINGKRSWEKNPWVWVLEFRKL